MSSDEFSALIGVFFALSSIGFAIAWIRTRERAIRAEAALAHYRPEKTLGSETSRPRWMPSRWKSSGWPKASDSSHACSARVRALTLRDRAGTGGLIRRIDRRQGQLA